MQLTTTLPLIVSLAASVSAVISVNIWANEDCTGDMRRIDVSSDCQEPNPGFSSLSLPAGTVPQGIDGIGLTVQAGKCGKSSSTTTVSYANIMNGVCSGGFGFTASDIYQNTGS